MLVLGKAWISDAHQFIDELIDHLGIRLVEDIELIDRTSLIIICKDCLRRLVNRRGNQILHIRAPAPLSFQSIVWFHPRIGILLYRNTEKCIRKESSHTDFSYWKR